jgi:hypothetical protein
VARSVWLSIAGSILLAPSVFLIWFLAIKRGTYFFMDPQDNLNGINDPEAWRLKGRTFIPILERYTDVVKTVIGLAAGSITLLVGFMGYLLNAPKSAHVLNLNVGVPLIVLAFSICYLFLCLVLLINRYEDYLVDTRSYTRFWYSLANALGYSGLICFAFGYFWLAVSVARLGLGHAN